MEINLEHLKTNFIIIKDIRSKVTNIFTILDTHLLNLKKTYSEFVENNRHHLFVFGLDSFQFQSKLIDIEYDDMKRLFFAINNRMYCEYYKLYKIISEYVKENIQNKKTLELIKINIFPVYKDLEPYKQYKFETIQEVHENIILLLYEINDFIINKENELQIHKQKQEIGLNINNFVTTFNYNIVMIKEKGMLFISYIDFFHNLHIKYLQRFTMKINLMYNQVTNDIRFEDTSGVSDSKKKELLKNYETENIDKTIIKQIKSSFNNSDSNSLDTPQKSNNLNQLSFISNTNINTSSEMENSGHLQITPKTTIMTSKSIQEQLSSFSPVNDKYKNIFKNNVNKFVNSIFKTKSNNRLEPTLESGLESAVESGLESAVESGLESAVESGLESAVESGLESAVESISSGSSINNVNILESKNEDNCIVFKSIPVENNIELKIEEEEVNINRTKTAEEIFMEISNQSDTLKENLYQERQDAYILEVLDIYDLKENNLVEREIVDDNKIKHMQDVEIIEEDINNIIEKVEEDVEIIKENINNIIERVEEDVKIKKDQKDQKVQKDIDDENMSVITMESLNNEKNIEIKDKEELSIEKQIEKEELEIPVVKNKKIYKPRKKN